MLFIIDDLFDDLFGDLFDDLIATFPLFIALGLATHFAPVCYIDEVLHKMNSNKPKSLLFSYN